jgi:ABC-type dipeptide/oligopeptide/nickel transport system ATPase component
MKIKKVAFWDNLREWRFEPICFSNLALLVGVSGVGKTQILKVILNLQRIANGASLNGLAWDVTFSTVNNVEYRWQGEFETKKNPGIITNEEDEVNKFRIVRENLLREGIVIIERTPREILFHDKQTPKLSPFQSVVEILNQEEDISPVQQAFNKILYSDNSSSLNGIYGLPVMEISKILQENIALKSIQETNKSIYIKLFVIAQNNSDIFDKIKHKFVATFPQVEDIKIEAVIYKHDPYHSLFPIQIKEKEVNKWIFQDNISSGMLKTLIHISELYLSPEGTVILIDEFENSLGINCIDVVTDLIVENRNIQFILTSHHPYIINNIGMDHWKIVTRKGGVVTVIDAKDLNLGKSRHQAFTQLINLEEYSEGIKVE